MSLLFLILKAVRTFESYYDWPIGLGLVALDLIWLAEWWRVWLMRRR